MVAVEIATPITAEHDFDAAGPIALYGLGAPEESPLIPLNRTRFPGQIST
jgi:hypothetical protein